MNHKLRYFLLHFCLILISALFTAVQLQRGPLITEFRLPYFIVETTQSADNLVSHLEARGFGPIIRKNSATLPISRFGSPELQTLVAREVRLQDLRVLSQLPRLLEEFQPADGSGDLVFVTGVQEYGELAAALRSYDGDYFVHLDHGLPRLFGLLLWALIGIILLLFFKDRRYSLIAMVAFLPGFLMQMPLYLGFSTILCISVREVYITLSTEFTKQVNKTPPDIDLPVKPMDYISFAVQQIHTHAAAPALWSLGLGLFVFFHAIITGEIGGIYISLIFIPLLIILMGDIVHIIRAAEEREHRLFFASHITPAWSKPSRKERAALLTILALVLALPFVFRVNISPFPTLLLREQVLGDMNSEEDLETLKTAVVALLNQRISGTGNDDHAIVEIILADRVYQQIFPYLSLSSNEGAGRYENGSVYLTRYEQSDETLNAYEELVFELTAQWLVEELRSATGFDMLQLYTDKEKWYALIVSSSVWVFPYKWNLLLEVLFLLAAGLPWIGRWHFSPIQKLRLASKGGDRS